MINSLFYDNRFNTLPRIYWFSEIKVLNFVSNHFHKKLNVKIFFHFIINKRHGSQKSYEIHYLLISLLKDLFVT